jgi:hypothetical protein
MPPSPTPKPTKTPAPNEDSEACDAYSGEDSASDGDTAGDALSAVLDPVARPAASAHGREHPLAHVVRRTGDLDDVDDSADPNAPDRDPARAHRGTVDRDVFLHHVTLPKGRFK